MSDKLLFADLKVIDMSSWIAAPVAATMLADFGAQVIKIEPPEAGDGYRNFALMASTPTSDVNYTWQMDNRNKRSLALNLKTEEGRKLLRQLVAESLRHQHAASDASSMGPDLRRPCRPQPKIDLRILNRLR